jgi:hypothetical protein
MQRGEMLLFMHRRTQFLQESWFSISIRRLLCMVGGDENFFVRLYVGNHGGAGGSGI